MTERTAKVFSWLCVGIVLVVLVILTSRNGSITANLSDTALGVVGSEGDPIFIDFINIDHVDLISSFERGTLLAGLETANTWEGSYENTEFGIYELEAYSNVDAFIVVYYGNRILVYNYSSKRSTNSNYKKLQEALEAL